MEEKGRDAAWAQSWCKLAQEATEEITGSERIHEAQKAAVQCTEEVKICCIQICFNDSEISNFMLQEI